VIFLGGVARKSQSCVGGDDKGRRRNGTFFTGRVRPTGESSSRHVEIFRSRKPEICMQTDARGHVDDVPNVSPMQSGEARSCAFVWTPEFFSYIFFFASKEPPTKNVFNCISTADSSYHDS
jgi:hypothetical protein